MFTYTVIGTGAVGGYYGGLLARAKHTVRFLARSDCEYIRAHGLTVESVRGDFHIDQVEVYASAQDIPPSDVVLISLKTTANAGLVDLLRPLVRKGTVLCVMQNGLTMEDELHAAFPESIIMGAMCYLCAEKRGPGLICHLDAGHLALSPFDEGGSSTVQSLCREFESAGIRSSITANLGEARWRKLLWNIPYNGLSVVLDSDTKKIMNTPPSRELVRALMGEVVAAAAACGTPIGEESITKMLEYTDSMTPYAPSMKLDYDHGRPMEIEYMYRRPVAAAKAAGCAMPKTEMLADLLSFRECDQAPRTPQNAR